MTGYTYIVSPNDIASVLLNQFNFGINFPKIPVTNKTITGRGLWEAKSRKPPSDPDLEYSNVLKMAEQVLKYHREELERCETHKESICDEIYGVMAVLLSNEWVELSYHSFSAPDNSVFYRSLERSLLTYIKDPKYQKFFKKTFEQLKLFNQGIANAPLEIRFDDPETRVVGNIQKNDSENRHITFRYVIDNNANPEDGRIYIYDFFKFDKDGKYLAQHFKRSFFGNSSGKPGADQGQWIRALNHPKNSPEQSQQTLFGEEIARKFFSRLQ